MNINLLQSKNFAPKGRINPALQMQLADAAAESIARSRIAAARAERPNGQGAGRRPAAQPDPRNSQGTGVKDCGCDDPQINVMHGVDLRDPAGNRLTPGCIVYVPGASGRANRNLIRKLDYKTIGHTGVIMDAVRDLMREGKYEPDDATLTVSGTDVAVTGAPGTNNKVLGFVISVGVSPLNSSRVKMKIETSGFLGGGGQPVDRMISYDITYPTWDIYVPFVSVGASPQDAHIALSSDRDGDAEIRLSGVPAAYSATMTVNWISANSPEIEDFITMVNGV